MTTASTPRYLQIYNELRQDILLFKYPPDTFLPPEEALTKRFECSRTTVRRALAMLRDDGLIEVRQGQGARVKTERAALPPKATSAAVAVGWDYEFDVTMFRVSTKPVVDLIPAELEVAKALQIGLGDSVYRIQYVRSVDNVPMAYVAIYLRADYVPGLEKLDFSGARFYYFLEDAYGIRFMTAHEQITAVAAGFMESNYLQIDIGFPLLVTQRVSDCQLGPFEYAILKNRTDKQHLLIERERIEREDA